MDKKIIIGILGGAIAVGGIVTTEQKEMLQNEIIKQQQEKHIILKDNIWLQVRLNQVPVWDATIVSAEEMTSAYIAKAEEEKATSTPSLFEGLKAKTIEQGLNCK